MNDMVKENSMDNDDYWTIQENRIIGSSEASRLKIANGRYWTPGSVLKKWDISIDELNRRRTQERYFHVPYYITYMLGYIGESDLALTFEPLNESGETIKDPQVLLVDKEGNPTAAPELTKRLYAKLREIEQQQRKDNPDLNNEIYSFFLRESPAKHEKETPEPPEGIRNV